jgi:hypothetical protein
MCELNARKQQKKMGKIPSFANSMAKAVGKAVLSSPALPALPTALGQAVGKDGLPLKHAPSFANNFGLCCWQS